VGFEQAELKISPCAFMMIDLFCSWDQSEHEETAGGDPGRFHTIRHQQWRLQIL